MKRLKIIMILFFVVYPFASHAVSIEVLFNALKKQPSTKIDRLIVKQANIGYRKALSELYPTVYAIGGFQHFNSPTSLRPVTPTESAKIARSFGSYPFSKNITQIGIEVKVPLLMLPLIDLSKKALALKKGAFYKKKLNFIRNEASVVVLNAKFEYLVSLEKALVSTQRYLDKQLEILKISVRSGRSAPINILNIQSAVNDLKIRINEVRASKNQVISAIRTLTGIYLRSPASMSLYKMPVDNGFLPLKPIEYQIKAKRYQVKAAENELLPKVYVAGTIFRKFGKSYNTGNRIVRNYGNIGIFVSIPIFDKPVYSSIEMAKSDWIKSKFEYQQTLLSLKSKAKELISNLGIVEKSLNMAKENVKDSESLVKYAEVAFRVGRMTVQDYLRYVSDLLNAKAKVYSLKMNKWEIISELAIIYGNDLKELVK